MTASGGSPSTNGLRVFAAAAESESFSAAGRQLGIGQPAISRQIAKLERELDFMLFDRTSSAAALTENGRLLFNTVQPSLAAIDETIRQLSSSVGHPTLVVDVSTTFAALWLLARLDDFTSAHPDIDLRLITRHENFRPSPDADVVVTFGVAAELERFEMVVPEELVIVCAREFLEGRKLSPELLARQHLLGLDMENHRDDWSRLLGEPGPSITKWYSNYTVYLQAVVDGHGIGIGWRQLIDRHLENGSLRLAGKVEVSTTRGYLAAINPSAKTDPSAKLFFEWLTNHRCQEAARIGGAERVLSGAAPGPSGPSP